MNIEEFIADFADMFDDTELCEFKSETRYRDLDEWSSLTGFAILNMISKKYGVRLTVSEVGECDTIESLFNLVVSRR